MNKKYKRVQAYIADNWKFVLPIVAGLAAIGFVLSFRLGSLVGGLSADEFAIQQQVAANAVGLETILRDPIFLPYYAALWLLQLTPFGGPAAVRVIGVAFGALGIFGMFYLLKSWYTMRIAILGTALFASTGWLLHTARYASPETTYLLVPLLIASMIALQAKLRSRIAMLAAIISGIGVIYIPGIIWFVVPALIVKRKVIIQALRNQSVLFKTVAALFGAAMVVPLVLMLVKPLPGASALGNLKQLAGLPETGIPSLIDLGRNLKDSLSDIFIYNTAGPIYTPGHLPWFDIATTCLAVLGLIQFVKHRRLDRSKLIAITGSLGLVLIALNGLVSAVILLPLLFLFILDGLRWLLDRWLTIFPRNPFARGFAVVVVTVLVGAIGFYQTNKYFYAWAQSPETREVFNNQP